MAQSDLRLTGDVEPRNATARLRGGPQRPAEPGSLMSRSYLPRKPALSSSGKLLFLAKAELCLTCVPSLRRASPPEGERMSFCDQMTAAIDGARTLTRLDHLSRSIWQGLAAGAVADDDAQT